MLGSLIVRRTAMRLCSSMAAAGQETSPAIATYSKNNLSKLRKRTGYTISNCKKALELNGNDLPKALEWLNAQALKEGWAKAQKLQGRKTYQGLIGIHVQNNVAAMVEVNCETDFVSRNQEFHNLVCAITTACHAHIKGDIVGDNKITKMSLTAENLATLPWLEQSGKTLSDLVALKIGQLGENMTLSRGIGLFVPEDVQIGHYAHPSSQNDAPGFAAGKYGSIVAFKTLSVSSVEYESGGNLAASGDDDQEQQFPPLPKRFSPSDCARQLCQHIVGMNPLTIGEIREKKHDEPAEAQLKENEGDETEMIHQEFLIDSTMTVGDFLEQNGIQVIDFVRYECGETAEEAL